MSEVQVVENWTDVQGIVQGVRSAADRPGFVVATVKVDSMGDVTGYPNLLGDSERQELDIFIPSLLVEREAVAPGRKLFVRVRLGGRRSVFAHPDHCRTE